MGLDSTVKSLNKKTKCPHIYIYIYALYQGITMITLLYVDDAKFCKCNCGCQGMITVFLADLDAHQPRRTILNSVFQDDCVNNNMVVGWHMCSWD